MDEVTYLLKTIGDLEVTKRLLLEKIQVLEARLAELEKPKEEE